MFASWVARVRSRLTTTPTARSPWPRFRPRLDGLEDRTVLSAPVAPPATTATLTNFAQNTPTAIPDANTVTSTIVVSGAGAYLLDVDVLTSIVHSFSADLDITVTSPAGTVVTLTTDNGGSNDNVFNGTRWDDSAGVLVDDNTYVNLTAVPTLAPEGALGAFVGENPNGTWTITVRDDLANDTGTLIAWSLDLTTLPTAPVVATPVTFTNDTTVAVPDAGVATSTITVSGLPTYLFDVDAITNLIHTFSGDLDVTITSPAGTVVTLTTDNGSSSDNVFNGTRWDDSAGLPVTDTVFVNGVPVASAIPEGALAAFIGENPNGVWTITVRDDTVVDTGSLEGWSLVFVTDADVTPPDTAIDSGPTSPTSDNTPTFVFSGTDDRTGVDRYEVSIDGGAYVTQPATFTPPVLSDGTHTVSVRAVDGAGNADPTPATVTFVVDTTAPTASVTSSAPAVVGSGPIRVMVTFSEPVTGFGASDVVVGNGTVSNFAGSGDTYTFDVTPVRNGAVTVSVPANAAHDAAGNGNAAPARLTRTYDAAPPVVTIGRPSATRVSTGAAVSYLISYSDTALGAVTLTARDVVLKRTGTANGVVTVTRVNATTFRVTVSRVTGAGTLGIALKGGTAVDQFGRLAPAVGPSAAFAVTAYPTLQITRARK